jgi:L-ascorbate metabolism protein UlaG (beta-lactamase superfamily)
MKKVKKIAKMIGIIIGSLILVVVLVGVLFVNLSPEFGGSATKAQKAVYEKSKNYKDGKFINLGGVKMNMGFGDMVSTLFKFFTPLPNTKPEANLPVEKIDSLNVANFKDKTRLIWFGHSAFLLQINNKNILIDPMFGPVPAPHPLLGSKRFSKELPIEIEQLPRIDAVIISHDHFDHLDYGSIQKLKDKVNMFYMPLGVGVHLQKWGIEKERIVELDWWQETNFEDLTFVCTPAQHFSGRGLTDRASTLWCSWIIQSETDNIYFSGDSGYGPHFKTIGEQYGPFDFAMLECGQYNEMWHEIHMFPEETAQAGIDIKAKRFMPIHWGAFKLALHPWTEPIKRVSKKAKELNIELVTPKIGEPIIINDSVAFPKEVWWAKY